MSPLSAFHLLTLASLVLVAARGPVVLLRGRRWMTSLERLAVILASAAAVYWLITSALLSNIMTCRADATLCLAGNVYQLLRNGSFLLVYRCFENRAKATA